MTSEKSRYLLENEGPELPFDIQDLSEKLTVVRSEELADLIWVRAQYDDVLCKVAMVTAGIRHANGDWEKIKKAIDYAVYFPEYIRHTDNGHGQIIDVIKSSLASLTLANKHDLMIKAAKYAVEKSEEVIENFEEDWEWVNSIKELKNWIKSVQVQGE